MEILASFPTVVYAPARSSPICINPSSSSYHCSSVVSSASSSSCCVSDRRISSFSSSTSVVGGGKSLLFGPRIQHGSSGGRGALANKLSSGSKLGTRFDDAAASRFGVCCRAQAQESGTLSKEANKPHAETDDSSVRSQGAATIYGDDSIMDEKKVMGEDDETEHRPRRFNFDYGFQAKFSRTGPTVPSDVVTLAVENFGREFKELRRSYVFQELKTIEPSEVDGGPIGLVAAYTGRGFVLFLRGIDKILTKYFGVGESKPLKLETNKEQDELRAELKKLVLSNQKVWDRENSREAVQAPWWILGPYYLLCLMLDVIFNKRPIQRFWFLETVARMPYFSYISMLHLYETLGWWRAGAEVRKVHFAEEWNEMHHLKIMESLGGDLDWSDRFIGQHAAFFYYWILNFMFLVSPSTAYNFSELIEAHAVDTYGEFADANEQLLKSLPPPPVAVAYYESEDLYMYDEFQTSNLPESRRPPMNSLHDVFLAISGDENEHVKTMLACQSRDKQVISPHRLEKMRK